MFFSSWTFFGEDFFTVGRGVIRWVFFYLLWALVFIRSVFLVKFVVVGNVCAFFLRMGRL